MSVYKQPLRVIFTCLTIHLPAHLVSLHVCFTSSSLHSRLSLLLQDSVWVNNRSRIVKSDYTTANGVIHHIDTLLTPYRLLDKPVLNNDMVQWSLMEINE